MADDSMGTTDDLDLRNGELSVEEMIAKDLPEYVSLLTQIKEKVTDTSSSLEMFTRKVKMEKIQTGKGISFLEVKFHMLLEYLINLVYTLLLKVDGKRLEGESCIERLIEVRTFLEKIRPIDQKLKYQVDKLIKMVTTGIVSNGEGQASGSHPLSFRPNPDNLVSKTDIGDQEDDEESEEDSTSKPPVYVPPKVSAVPYEEGTRESKKRKLEERVRQHTLNSSLLKDLRDEYSEAPEELKEDYKGLKASKMKDLELEKERYEEENLMRLPTTKKDKKIKRSAGVDELFTFDNVGVLDLEGSDNEDTYRQKHSRGKKSKKFKKGKKFKSKFKRK